MEHGLDGVVLKVDDAKAILELKVIANTSVFLNVALILIVAYIIRTTLTEEMKLILA